LEKEVKGSISATFSDNGIGNAYSMNKIIDKKEIKIVIMKEVKIHQI
jgi:hypothetical protein